MRFLVIFSALLMSQAFALDGYQVNGTGGRYCKVVNQGCVEFYNCDSPGVSCSSSNASCSWNGLIGQVVDSEFAHELDDGTKKKR
jgi:hypothetical protein